MEKLLTMKLPDGSAAENYVGVEVTATNRNYSQVKQPLRLQEEIQ